MTKAVLWRRAVLGTALVGAGSVALCAVRPRAAPPRPLPVTWIPDPPQQGAAVVIIAGPDTARHPGRDTVVAVTGTLAGERLRFERGRDGRFRALGAIPVSAAGSIALPLAVVRRLRDTTYQFLRAPVGEGSFGSERLRLPPRFVTPPASLRAQLEEERRTILAALARTARTPRLWSGRFDPPVTGRVTEAFGTRRVINGAAQARHLGVDLAGRPGTPVRAANRGVVLVAGRFYYQGNAVYLDHGAGLVTSYMHLSRILVSADDSVRAGQVIGLVGATGRVTGPHLHWSAYFGRVLFDPMTLQGPAVQLVVDQEGNGP
jgi:hypothetical protein